MKTTSPKTIRSTFRGVFPAVVTPMNANEEIDFPQLTAFTDYLVRKGVHGLIPLGSTGEYYALSAAERERVLRSTLEVVAGRVPVVAGANAGSTRDRRDLRSHALRRPRRHGRWNAPDAGTPD